MQIGITINGFTDVDGLLMMSMRVQFNHPSGQRGDISGTVPFNTTNAEARQTARQWIKENYNLDAPGNVTYRIIGF